MASTRNGPHARMKIDGVAARRRTGGASNTRWEAAVRQLLELIGEDATRSGLSRTPLRVRQSLQFLTSGYEQDPADFFKRVVGQATSDEMVIVRNIDFFSLCEHHLLPFFGKCHVAYLPDSKIIGLSKMPRLVDLYARRLQVQERLTSQIADALNLYVQPRGVACVMEGQHLCMMMRGVQKQNSVAVTSAMLGQFRTNEKTRAEFLSLIRSSS